VSAAVKIAGTYGIPIYPVSRGKNWGQGDACPVREGQAVLDLSGMDRIVEVNAELAYAVVEPGVTQGQLALHLENFPTLMLDVTASAADSSLLGNYIERGDGFSPYGERFSHCCGMEVVLPDGSVVETGYARFALPDDSGCRYLAKWGTGPSLDGLFSQSN
jgi:4-cresol dehydrogenase (hydroxylating)